MNIKIGFICNLYTIMSYFGMKQGRSFQEVKCVMMNLVKKTNEGTMVI